MESTDPLLVNHAERLSRLEGIAEQLNKMLETFGAEIRDQRARADKQFYTLITLMFTMMLSMAGLAGGGTDEIVDLWKWELKALS